MNVQESERKHLYYSGGAAQYNGGSSNFEVNVCGPNAPACASDAAAQLLCSPCPRSVPQQQPLAPRPAQRAPLAGMSAVQLDTLRSHRSYGSTNRRPTRPPRPPRRAPPVRRRAATRAAAAP